MKKYILTHNRSNNSISIKMGEYSPDIMKINLTEFLEEADKFFKDKQDGIYAKGATYNFYGDALEIKREYATEEIEKDIIYMFVYCGENSGMGIISYKDLWKFTQEADIDLRIMPSWERGKGWYSSWRY